MQILFMSADRIRRGAKIRKNFKPLKFRANVFLCTAELSDN